MLMPWHSSLTDDDGLARRLLHKRKVLVPHRLHIRREGAVLEVGLHEDARSVRVRRVHEPPLV